MIAIAAGVALASAAPAQALNVPGIIGQAVDTVDHTVRDGLFDTARSVIEDGRAHAYVAVDPQTRYIVVLGARINADGTLPEVLNQRLDTAAAIARAHPGARIIATGGPTQAVPYSEAQAMFAALVLRGVNPANILTEEASRSTVENAQNTTRILRRAGAKGAVIVSSQSHVDRALANFEQAAPDLNYLPVGVRGW